MLEGTTKATLRETREHNERLVLATIYDRGPISRAEAARLTGLTRTTVSGVVEGLISSGLAREIGRGPSTGGKAPILLEVPHEARLLIGVDLGDRVFTAATVSLRGEILRRFEVPSEDADGDEALDLAMRLMDRVIAAADGPVLGVGIGAPGLVDTTDGTVVEAVKRDWRDLPLGSLVAGRFKIPVYVANDSQAAALAEHVFTETRGANLIVIKVGQGIGAGVVLNGQLFQGDRFGAGEIGHTVMDPQGDVCRCGRRGCLETTASARAVLTRVASLRGKHVSMEQAVADFQRGDARVRDIVLEAGAKLGGSVASLIGALHVRRIVLAGTMAAFGEPWLQAVSAAASSRSLAALASDTTFELGRIDDIVVLGASALLMTRELGLSLRPLHPMPRPRTFVREAVAEPTAQTGVAPGSPLPREEDLPAEGSSPS
ncbi:MAG: ROK family transcriptional regulator [Candidatus Limnocylindrales bacterium]